MSYKKKNIILVISFIILLGFIYVFSISKTLDSKIKYTQLLKEKEKVENSASEVMLLREQSIYLDSILKKENISVTNSFQQILLKKITDFKLKDKIELIEFSNVINVKDGEIDTQLYPITIQGSFNELLSFLNYLEQQGLGEIKNVNFFKKKNYNTSKELLLLKLFLKKIG